MRVVTVHAYGIASTLKPREIVELLTEPGDDVKQFKTHALIRRTGEQGDAFVSIHDFGALVFFDIGEMERDRIVSRVLKKVGPEPHPPLVDDYLLEVRGGEAPTVTFDRAVVPDLERPVIELVALVLAQSVALDYYDEDVLEMSKGVDAFASVLATRGAMRGRDKEVRKFVGSTMVTRTQILTTMSLLDAPPITWEREDYDRLYRSLRATFEIDDRYRTFEHKSRIVHENLSIIVDLVQHRRAAMLEVIVIALILFEVLFTLWERLGKR